MVVSGRSSSGRRSSRSSYSSDGPRGTPLPSALPTTPWRTVACWSILRELRSDEGKDGKRSALTVIEEVVVVSVSPLGPLLGPLELAMDAPEPEDPRDRGVLLVLLLML
jgi:hypothetical protein